jgi:hypothetical protein
MRKIIFLINILFTSLCIAQHIIPQKQIGLEIQCFYQHPGSTLLSDIIKSMDEDSTFLSNPNTNPVIIGFLTVALSKYHEKSEGYQEMANELKFKRSLVLYCLELSGVKDTILNWPGHNSSINDLHWGGFFASGDTRYLERLVSELQYCDNKDSLNLFLTGNSAKWSLCSNAINYPEVKQYLEHASDAAPAALKSQLIDVLHSSSAELKNQMLEGIKQFKNTINDKDVDSLCAMKEYHTDGLALFFILIKDKKFFNEWAKPDTPKISSNNTYKRGEDVYPVIIFSTDGKDENGNADLTYDIKIIKPDGTLYSNFEQLEIWKKAPLDMLQLVKQKLDIHIENNDPFGVYKIHSVVHDNIKKIDVDFNLSFKVIE